MALRDTVEVFAREDLPPSAAIASHREHIRLDAPVLRIRQPNNIVNN
jgi:hypothetical protein